VVFRNSKKRRALEGLIHPYVFDRIREELVRARAKIVVAEIPLLFESGFHRLCDCRVVVRAPRSKVIDRLLGKGFGRQEIQERWRAQWPLGEKIRRAEFVIDNSDGLRKTRREAARVWKEIEKRERSTSTHAKRER